MWSNHKLWAVCFGLIISFNLFAKEAIIDVKHYQINIRPDFNNKHISGSNAIRFKFIKVGDEIVFKLAINLKVDKITRGLTELKFTRDSNLIRIPFFFIGSAYMEESLVIYYSGLPKEAKKAPWDGGFVWSKDSMGNPWLGLACEGIGASSWLPCKDTWDDEPESASITLEVPTSLMGVSNGRLVRTEPLTDALTAYTWEIKSPINHYNLTVNVGKYAHLTDFFINGNGDTLSLDYYVLEPNAAKARTHFQQVKRMLGVFESNLGPYPFYKDGYKLVETPYWGMEHQSCVAYGNNYENNAFGFDFIIIHESAHEWFANSLTAKDKADMWLHESFTTYCEALYVEKIFGLPRSLQYLELQKKNIKNEQPMIGVYGTNHAFKDNDIYYKGTWILHTLRNMVDNDTLWFQTLRLYVATYHHKLITTEETESFFSKQLKMDLKPFFDQYLRHTTLPELQFYIVEKNGLNELHYRMNANVKLSMPIKVTLAKDKFDFIVPGFKWKVMDLPYSDPSNFRIDTSRFLVNIKRVNP